MKKCAFLGRFSCILILVFYFSTIHAKTRWSSLHLIPDADLINGGSFVLESANYLFVDDSLGYKIRPCGMINIGLIEWVNLQMGYTGSFNLGLKARILGETRPWLPSLAVGVRNAFSHQEAYFFNKSSDSLRNELFAVFGKSIDPIRLRIHLGIQSVIGNKNERINPFMGIEKFFGNGLYITVEVHRRDTKFVPSLFGSFRFLKKHVEVSAGLVDISGLLLDEGGQTSLSLKSSSEEGFMRPGIWFGLRFQGNMKFGKSEDFMTLEDRFSRQNTDVKLLRAEIDSLKGFIKANNTRIETMGHSMKQFTDSITHPADQLKNIVYQKLVEMKAFYTQEPFEPEAVKNVKRELSTYRERIIPALNEIALNRKEDIQVRMYAVTIMGEIGSREAADALIEILGQAQNPEMKIEALISLGKLKETRAVFLMQQLTADPHEGVAFAASEVLQKLQKETGILVSGDQKKNVKPEAIPESKIGTKEKAVGAPKIEIPVNQADTNKLTESAGTSITAVKKPEITEQTITAEKSKKNDSLTVKTANDSDSIEWETDSTAVIKADSTQKKIQELPKETKKNTKKETVDQKSTKNDKSKKEERKRKETTGW